VTRTARHRARAAARPDRSRATPVPDRSRGATPADALSDGLIAFILVQLVVIAFFPALRAGFVLWDDDTYFLNNPSYRGLGPAQLSWMFTVMSGHYMPLTWLTHGLDYVLWGMQPGGYHLVKVLLHALGTVTAYFVALRLLAAAVAPEPRWARRFAAALAALLFAVHPLRVESVAWITERRDVLCGVLFLLAVLCYLRAVDADTTRARGWYWTSVALAALALLSKAMAVTLPAVLVLLDVYPLRRIGPFRWNRREVWAEKIPFALLSAAAAVLAIVAQRAVGTLSDLRDVGVFERFGLTCYGLVFYLWKTLVPTKLAPLYEAPRNYDALTLWFAGAALIVGVITVALVRVRARWPGLTAAGVAFAVLLLPVLGLLHFGLHIVADRNTYFAGLAPAMLAGGIVLHVLRRAPSAMMTRATAAVAVSVVLILGVMTWRQSLVWRDSRTLWTHAVEASPSSVGYAKLGVLLEEEGKTEEAIVQFRRALQLRPDNAYAENNWGIALGNAWRFHEALAHFEAALRIRPDYVEARRNLKLTLARAINPVGYLDAQRASRERLTRGEPR
jgi:tetratricopeptide (TPR) repeat protein